MEKRIVKITSITKKLLVALFAACLLLFLLFHMTANLFILKQDDGVAYSAFCHFMGSNPIVKVFEVGLLAIFVLHICLASWLWYTNRKARPVRYHQPTKSRTGKGSKLAMITGSLLLVCLLFHFYDFFFVKLNFVEGSYMTKSNELMSAAMMQEGEGYAEDEMLIATLFDADHLSQDMKCVKNISAEQRRQLEALYPTLEVEPDFYTMARQKFSIWHIVLGYLIFFAVVGIHIRHGFEAAFQTFGLNHHKYARLVEMLGIIYCWVVCIGFAAVPILVYLGF